MNKFNGPDYRSKPVSNRAEPEVQDTLDDWVQSTLTP